MTSLPSATFAVPARGMPASHDSSNRATPWFWVLGAVLVLYVALCTGHRDNIVSADAWEHLRVVHTLKHRLWNPGNPTYASPAPSIRYSPYTIGIALFSRMTHLSSYTGLSIAAVANTALLVAAVWMLLCQFGEAASAGAVLLAMVALYGAAPGYANSYALADLPWQEVNPSAFSFAVTLFAWALLKARVDGRAGRWAWPALVVMSATAVLDHGMTGAFDFVGLFLIALLASPTPRKHATAVFAVGVAAFGLCLLWPWYPFATAVFSHPNNAYWFNGAILTRLLTQWAPPALICALAGFMCWQRPLVRICLAGSAACVLLGGAAYLTHSPVLARLPLPGLVFAHIAVGIFLCRSGALFPSTWKPRLQAFTANSARTAPAVLEAAVAIVVLFFLRPQLVAALRKPYLARAYVAPWLHKQDKQTHLLNTYRALLDGVVRRHDVVLAGLNTGWPIPGVAGKIVGAEHFEFFAKGQTRRVAAVQLFFSGKATNAQRLAIIKRYHVRWIVLNKNHLPGPFFRRLCRPAAVVRRVANLTLLNAALFAKSGD